MNANDIMESFRTANPGIDWGRGGAQGQPRMPPGAMTLEGVLPSRVLLAGGETVAKLANPTFVPFERLFRVDPPASIYTASPQENAVVTLGQITVPRGMAFALIDYSFDLYRQSGAVAGDYVPVENRRLSGQIGYDYVVNDYRSANVEYQLDPGPAPPNGFQAQVTAGVNAAGAEFDQTKPPQIGNIVFPPSAPPSFPSAADFARARSASAASASGAGLALQPQRRERLGALGLPFTEVVRETQTLVFRAVAFRRVPIPLAFLEVDVTGLLMSESVLLTLLGSTSPAATQGGTGR